MTLLLVLACTSKPAVLAARGEAPQPSAPTAHFLATAEGVEARLPSGTRVQFSAEGAQLGSEVQLRTVGIGRAGLVRPLAPTRPGLADCDGTACVRFAWPGLTEDWVGTTRGVEQTWTITARPQGDGDLEVILSADAEVAVNGEEARVGAADARWRASGAHAWDSDRRALPTRLVERAGGLGLDVNDQGARYPIWVDPTYEEADYTANGGTFVVAGGGDVNSDGYVDLFMSSHHTNSAGAYLYLGADDGFPESACIVFPDLYDLLEAEAVPVAFAGDINADGFDEFMVSAPAAGGVRLYAGGAEISTDPIRVFPEFAGGAFVVAAVAGAGDLNSDGYADIVIGVPDYEGPSHAIVYLGSPEGPVTAGIELQGEHPGEDAGPFGVGVDGAGDVNGDGYGDLVVAGYGSSIEVYYGSEGGVSDDDRMVTEVAQQAIAVAGAGDVNGDGYDDVLVGEPYEVETYVGRAELYLGGPSGLDPDPVWERAGVEDWDRYGYAVAGAGDVNADGYADIITGTEQVPEVFLGSTGGPGDTPIATLPGGVGCSLSTAGDVDRDGLDDVVTCGGYVFLAKTFLNPTLADGYDLGLPNPEYIGCSTVAGHPEEIVLLLPLGLLMRRRRRRE